MDILFTIYLLTILFILGTVLGSFLNCLAYRLVHGGSVLKGRSKCPDCEHVLGAKDLVPVFSYLFLKGKCRYCGKKISIRYPLSEIVLGIAFVLCFLSGGLSLDTIMYIILSCCLFTLSITDIDDMIIPDGCLIVASINFLIFAFLKGMSLKEIGLRVITALGVGAVILLIVLLMDKILKKESMGGGDIKLFAVCALYLGLVGSLFSIFFACIIGLVIYSINNTRLAKQNNGEGSAIFPFGPSISTASFIVLLFGQPLIAWYVSLIS